MELLIKILFFIFGIFQINICESKVFVFVDASSEITFLSNFYAEKNKVELQNLFSINDIANTCKSESDLVDYRNWGTSVEAMPLRR